MKYRYALPDRFIDQVAAMEEFANGATQLSLVTKDGRIFPQVLISGSRYIIAMRGVTDLPFAPEEIAAVHQNDDDKNPKERSGWHYWDRWHPESSSNR